MRFLSVVFVVFVLMFLGPGLMLLAWPIVAGVVLFFKWLSSWKIGSVLFLLVVAFALGLLGTYEEIKRKERNRN